MEFGRREEEGIYEKFDKIVSSCLKFTRITFARGQPQQIALFRGSIFDYNFTWNIGTYGTVGKLNSDDRRIRVFEIFVSIIKTSRVLSVPFGRTIHVTSVFRWPTTRRAAINDTTPVDKSPTYTSHNNNYAPAYVTRITINYSVQW